MKTTRYELSLRHENGAESRIPAGQRYHWLTEAEAASAVTQAVAEYNKAIVDGWLTWAVPIDASKVAVVAVGK